ncbi:MAG: hypothetical protein EWV85_16425 [Microcystis aeruginosa Ma_QC_C_20070703_M131]|uniref:Uncharacterized protein n=1 Tax=Microcystis aeruginosa Ma_QC_C_20070703_M131 TaxID=2486263 RepID=A0A551XNB4_MICAE|nr:MAG: hypothetical protein EWV85_16425 [Microcystis aeruginosa Ma_QC_C_20070703_M131]
MERIKSFLECRSLFFQAAKSLDKWTALLYTSGREYYNTKSVFNSVINSQVIDCFSPLPAPNSLLRCSPIPFKQDLV